MWSVVRLEFKSEEGEVTRYFHNLFFEKEVLESDSDDYFSTNKMYFFCRVMKI